MTATRGRKEQARGVWSRRELELPGRGGMRISEAMGPKGAPALVLLHGLAATGRLNWFSAMPALAEHYRVVVVDHRGHGGGIRTRHFRLADCADDAVAVADALGIESFSAVGYSMGGPIAKLCWSRHRERVRGLVLCATARHFIKPEVRVLASAVMPGAVLSARLAPKFFQDRFVESMVGRGGSQRAAEFLRQEVADTDPATLMQAVRALIRFSSHDWLGDIDVPTAVLVATQDRLVPPERQRKLAASIPGAKVFEVDGDHLVCANDPERFVPALLAACAHVAGPPS